MAQFGDSNFTEHTNPTTRISPYRGISPPILLTSEVDHVVQSVAAQSASLTMTLVRLRRHRSCRSAYSRRLLVALAIFTIISIAEILSVHYTLSKPAWEEPSDLVPLPRVFIVGIHWNNEKILREHWNHALVALTNKIGPENVFVSIYESGSWDDTKGALRSLDYALEELKIPRRIVLDETTHLDEISRPPSVNGWVHTPGGTPELRRIPYLAQLRNAAMQPLYDIQNITIIPFDKIIFLNDVVFDVRSNLQSRRIIAKSDRTQIS
jgi:hypothetical protein